MSEFRTIRERVQGLKPWSEAVAWQGIMPIAEIRGDTFARFVSLVNSYESARLELNTLTSGKMLLTWVDFKEKPSYENKDIDAAIGLIEIIVVNCDKALGYLETTTSSVSREVIDTLNSLRVKVASVDEFNTNLYKHIMKSIEEEESGHFLASALLASKVVDFVLNQLPGNADEVKTEFLVQNGVLERGLMDAFLRGIKKSRNYYTHDLGSVPEPQEALGLLSTACDVAIKFSKIRRARTPGAN